MAGMLLPALCSSEGTGTFRAGSSLVLVNVSALDSHDRPVTGLSREDFHVLDNGREQPIRSFAHDDAPLSVAIVLDSSGSMGRKWNRACAMLARLCEQLGPEDEFFLVTVQQRARLLLDYTSNCGTMQNRLVMAKPHGMTALLDAIPLAVEHLRKAAHPRHAILIISDGGENASRVRLHDVRRQAREANAPVYAATLGLEAEFDQGPYLDARRGPELLREIAQITGGRAFSIQESRRIEEAAAGIARELHDQYVIGFESPDTAHDGQHHRISIKVRREFNAPRLSLFYRTGYRAPEE
uniref:von Willebrand factor, type A n=1 Tax=Solibacter usitatus (strain Ellin6076) TaxID=234267 RepID=Q02CM7_SOLUE